MADILLNFVCGSIIVGAIYGVFFWTLERLVRRDEGSAPIANSYATAAKRVRKSDAP